MMATTGTDTGDLFACSSSNNAKCTLARVLLAPLLLLTHLETKDDERERGRAREGRAQFPLINELSLAVISST